MEMTQKDLYNELINQGKAHDEAINTIIDFFTNGLSASWENGKWETARKIVESNLLQSI